MLPGSDGPKYEEGAFLSKKRVRGRKEEVGAWYRQRAIITGRFLAAADAAAVVSVWKEGSAAGGQRKMIQNTNGRTLTLGGA